MVPRVHDCIVAIERMCFGERERVSLIAPQLIDCQNVQCSIIYCLALMNEESVHFLFSLLIALYPSLLLTGG